jgi:hypothetical protein
MGLAPITLGLARLVGVQRPSHAVSAQRVRPIARGPARCQTAPSDGLTHVWAVQPAKARSWTCATGRETYGAMCTGTYDDLVMAVALATVARA